MYGSIRGYTGPPEGLKVWWNCTVDGDPQPSDPHPTVDENYHRLCYNPALDWKDHDLILQVTSKDNEPFYFDTMDYHSGMNETRTNKRTIVSIDDEELGYSTGWGNRGLYKITNVKGGNLKFPFDGKRPVLLLHPCRLSSFSFATIGVSVAWYGGNVTWMSQIPSSATWSVDGSPPVEFKIPGPSLNQHRTKIFETPKLTPGTHMLEVVYNGDHSLTPLTLWQLYIDHGGLPDSLNDSTACGEAKPTDIKMAAVGGGLGAGLVLALGLLIFLFLRYRKRETYKKDDPAGYSADTPPDAAAYSAVQQYDPDTAQAANIDAYTVGPARQPVNETMYAGHVSRASVPQPGLTLRTRAVPPTLPMRTGKAFVQNRGGTVDTGLGSQSLRSQTLTPGSSDVGSSVAQDEHPPVYSPDRY